MASPVVAKAHLPKVYDDFDKQDFAASLSNPYDATSPRSDFTELADELPDSTRLLDLGGGMGKFSELIKLNNPRWQVTHSDFAIKANPQLNAVGIKTRALNFLDEPIGECDYDLITAWEVIEHVPEELDTFLRNVWTDPVSFPLST